MHHAVKVTGVILAGGLARRMENRDKGLVQFNGRPLISYAIQAMTPIVGQLLINANRNQAEYRQFGRPVIADQTDSFDGPLAGILTALSIAETELLLVMPCDSPLIKTRHLERMLHARATEDAEIAVAFDGERLHPVFLVLKTNLKDSLEAYLADGQRKLAVWLAQHHSLTVDFSDEPEVFTNINSLVELAAVEKFSSK